MLPAGDLVNCADDIGSGAVFKNITPDAEIERLIAPATFAAQKAVTLREVARRTVREYGGKLPSHPYQLRSLPGIGPAVAKLAVKLSKGEMFDGAEEHLAALEPQHVQQSDELYFLSSAGGDTVKIRDGLLDVKRLEQVNRDGLELWLPLSVGATIALAMPATLS